MDEPYEEKSLSAINARFGQSYSQRAPRARCPVKSPERKARPPCYDPFIDSPGIESPEKESPPDLLLRLTELATPTRARLQQIDSSLDAIYSSCSSVAKEASEVARFRARRASAVAAAVTTATKPACALVKADKQAPPRSLVANFALGPSSVLAPLAFAGAKCLATKGVRSVRQNRRKRKVVATKPTMRLNPGNGPKVPYWRAVDRGLKRWFSMMKRWAKIADLKRKRKNKGDTDADPGQKTLEEFGFVWKVTPLASAPANEVDGQRSLHHYFFAKQG